jgi:sensor histidine kinase YesM
MINATTVLKYVTEPPVIMGAVFNGTIVSFLVFVVSLFILILVGTFILDLSFMVLTMGSVILSLALFGITQLFMVAKTRKDYYFLSSFGAGFRCGKTKNLTLTKDNFYGA